MAVPQGDPDRTDAIGLLTRDVLSRRRTRQIDGFGHAPSGNNTGEVLSPEGGTVSEVKRERI